MSYMCCQHGRGRCAGDGVQAAVLVEWGDGSATNGEQRSSGGRSAREIKRAGGAGVAHQVRLCVPPAT